MDYHAGGRLTVGWRDIKRQGRRDVHLTMRVPAVYLSGLSGEPAVRVNVRVHTRFATIQPTESGAGMAALLDTAPRLVFDRTEVAQPVRNALVAVSETEIYRLSNSRPPEPDFITMNVTELSEADAAEAWDDDWAALLEDEA